jgi:hypothetical protein
VFSVKPINAWQSFHTCATRFLWRVSQFNFIIVKIKRSKWLCGFSDVLKNVKGQGIKHRTFQRQATDPVFKKCSYFKQYIENGVHLYGVAKFQDRITDIHQ